MHFRGQFAFVQLRFHFPGDELLARELGSAVAPVERHIVEQDIHTVHSPACRPGCLKWRGNASARYDMVMRHACSRFMDSGRTSKSSHRPSVSAERALATSTGSTSE